MSIDAILREPPESKFRRHAANPRTWLDVARECVWAANRLRREVKRKGLGFGRRRHSERERVSYRAARARPVVFMYAVAAENYLKAILIGKGVDPLGSDGRIDDKFATHDLPTLAARAGLRRAHAKTLEQLAGIVRSGKYPVGRSAGTPLNVHNYGPEAVCERALALLADLEATLADLRHPDLPPAADPARIGVRR